LISQNVLGKVSQLQDGPNSKHPRREVDLDRHIEAKDQETVALQNQHNELEAETSTWPASIKDDYQVKSAYMYLKSLGKYSINHQK
jgi:hypothetical protein